ncbi:electron transfer flavoprotein-ubiquinone oxidoreductase [Hyphomonas johnsonii]|uniref:Electron transfer flavoprotein-ubiquinone oxidoreductase n=1 Tax=Hyphomonas johnsonii MHS-2 TaxID=1280950 RepID=A0A059FRK9_9PROT|nr:electron transfer flavoprotein-ubiquinone oxidoreductase [Hyphomonas johnsonii]KCZ93309.1 putative electron transfer flavoprotein-ubiquinone oxidoreductase [Hyphomonas johnsonii MHS-2]
MADDAPQRESMEYDLVIVGGGPAGLSAAIRFKQAANAAGEDLSVVVLEKGGEIGAHILSGIVLDPKALNELLPDWKSNSDCPLKTEVKVDRYKLLGESGSAELGWLPFPPLMSNHGCYTGSLANVCRWLGREAEALGVEIYPGFAASDVVYGEKGEVRGVVAGVMGIGADGEKKPDYEPGMELIGKYVLFAEGARGSLTKQVMKRFDLEADCDPQKFGIGLKEVWSVPEEIFVEGLVQHSFGWPVNDKHGNGGGFLYHFRDNGEPFVSVGYVVHLNYKNPYLAPYEEFQRYKHHPDIKRYLEGGKRVAYGARAITSGGLQSIPKLSFPGGALIGCCAGFVNLPRIKGTHNAMKTGMLGAEAAFEAIRAGRSGDEMTEYDTAMHASWVQKDLATVRNMKPLMSRFGTMIGAMIGVPDMWMRSLVGFSFLPTLKHGKTDAASLQPAKNFKPIAYPKPDGKLSFDKLTNVSFTNTFHGEDQPVHLKVLDMALQKSSEHDVFDGPSARYCPAGVYEWITEGDQLKFQINAQNCIHCKTCDIKDPNQNINWTVPEGGGGPAYTNM